MRWGIGACAAASLLCACGELGGELGARRASEGGARYTIVEIPPLPGDAFANAWDIDEADQVVGASFDPYHSSAVPFLWDPVHGTRLLIDVQGHAVGITERGLAAANQWTCGGRTLHAVSARTDGTFQDLGTLGNPSGSCDVLGRSEANAINRAGAIVGCSQRVDGAMRAFESSDGRMVELPTQGGPSRSSCAWAINDRGQIAGEISGDIPHGHAFLLDGDQLTDIGASFAGFSSARAINGHGEVAGDLVTQDNGEPPNQIRHAFLYSQGVLRDLGGIGGSMRVLDMNDQGQIVGGNGQVAFLWEQGLFHDLRTLVDDPTATFYEARAINDQGHIVASGGRGGRNALMLLVPAPGPLVPVAAFDGSSGQGYAPLWEGLDGTRSFTTDPRSWITACRWSFGDGTPDEDRCWALHVYTLPGTYSATLTVTDNQGNTASTSLAIEARPNPGPVPVVQYGPSSGRAPLAVFMDGTHSYAVRQNGWIAACRWDFGDGSEPDTRCWALHTYAQPGHYTARFTVTDDQGVSNAKALDVDTW